MTARYLGRKLRTLRFDGFSLVEMLVALSIFSMLLAVLMAGYSQGLSLWERGEAKSSRWLSIQHRHELLRKLFFNTGTADYRGANSMTYPHFFANQNELSFTTSAPVLDFQGRARPVRIVLEKSEEGTSDLYYQEAGRHDDIARGIQWDSGRRVRLLEKILNPTLRYLAPASPLPPELFITELTAEDKLRYRDAAEWLDWYDSSIIWKAPLMVKLNFADEQGTEHTWSFQIPGKSDAWSLRGQLDDY